MLNRDISGSKDSGTKYILVLLLNCIIYMRATQLRCAICMPSEFAVVVGLYDVYCLIGFHVLNCIIYMRATQLWCGILYAVRIVVVVGLSDKICFVFEILYAVRTLPLLSVLTSQS